MIRLKDIFGQDAAVQTIRLAHRADRLPHGLIFSGPSGIGKETTALALAGLFLCERPGPLDACAACPSCAAMSAGTHPDCHVVVKEQARMYDKTGASKATQLSINVIRHEVAAAASRKPALGRGKVFLIEEAELMTDAAQNALLKTLEEPSGRALLILLTNHDNDLLATVRSRCQIVRFAPLDPKLVRTELEKRGVDAKAAAEAAELSGGSLGVALRWIEDDALRPAAAVAEAVDAVLAGAPADDLADLLRKNADAFCEKVLARDELASKDSALRNGLAMYLSIVANRLGRWLRQTGDPDMLERACAAIDAVTRAEKYLAANVNVALILEQLGLTLGQNA